MVLRVRKAIILAIWRGLANDKWAKWTSLFYPFQDINHPFTVIKRFRCWPYRTIQCISACVRAHIALHTCVWCDVMCLWNFQTDIHIFMLVTLHNELLNRYDDTVSLYRRVKCSQNIMAAHADMAHNIISTVYVYVYSFLIFGWMYMCNVVFCSTKKRSIHG